jgi:DNA/RNA endonuclease G (NUC1)
MNLRRSLLAALATLVFATSAFAVSTTVVISEFRVRGPAGGNDEFIELLNVSGASVSIAGWKVNGSNNAAGTSTRATIPAGTTLGAGCRYLLTNSASGGYTGPVAGNQTYGTGVTDDGGIALLDAASNVIDSVGMSSGSAYKEGTTLASLGSNNLDRGYARKNGGVLDTDNNATDFELVTPSGPQSGCPNTPTNPTGVGAANPASLPAGSTTVLTVTVTPGANPASTGLAVSGNLSAIGGSATQQFFDDGTNGDAVANNNVFTYTATVASGTTGGAKSLAFTVTDAQARSSNGSISLTVTVPTNPSGTGSANPSTVARGSSTVLTVNVTPGTIPASTGITVTGDLTSIGGSASQSFSGSGNTFTFTAAVPFSVAAGVKSVPVSIADAQGRNGSTSISVNVVNAVVPVGAIVISQVYGGGGNAGSTLRNDFIELFNRSDNPVDLTGWAVQHYSSSNTVWLATPLSGIIQPHSYYLVQEAAGTGGTVDLPTPDAAGTIGLSSTAGITALTNTADALASQCAVTAAVMDFFSYGGSGASITCSGKPAVGGPLNSSIGVSRVLGGCKYTPAATDFSIGAPAPRNSSSPVNNCTTTSEETAPHVMISQIYGGGGNAGGTSTPPAVFKNDFVELYNPTDGDVDLGGWSIQYAPATGTVGSSLVQPLGGIIRSHEYFLIALGSGGSTGADLDQPRITGGINMSATNGKIALVKRYGLLSGNCPITDPDVVDYVGYGTADCFEGGLTAPSGSNASGLIRTANSDTNQNRTDFSVAAPPTPRGSGDPVELPPLITTFEPGTLNLSNNPPGYAAYDASVTVNFSEPVDVADGWYSINCTTTGAHAEADVVSAFSGRSWVVTPKVAFAPSETCTVHLFSAAISDHDLEDAFADHPLNDTQWTFTVAAAQPVEGGNADVHLAMGNPSNAIDSFAANTNYLMKRPEFALSYNADKGTANWVSWHLITDWTGALSRDDTFRPDPTIPFPTWYRVNQFDYSGTGYDRGHMCPNADRDGTWPSMQATFLMTNMVPQTPNNNQGPWAKFEDYLRSLIGTTAAPTNELYIVSGPNGSIGTIANGHVTVPASTWKVVLVLPRMDNVDDVGRVTAAARTIAIQIPNDNTVIKEDDWTKYLTTVRSVEQLTGYNFFSNVPAAIQNSIELGTNGNGNPPGVDNQTTTTDEDTAIDIVLNAENPGTSTVTFTTSSPANGSLSGTAPNLTYTPALNFNGTDSFTFTAGDGLHTSVTATFTINVRPVNDAPQLFEIGDQSVNLGSTLRYETVATDVDSPTLSYSLSTTAPAHAAISSTGVLTFTPDASQANQTFIFDVIVTDGAATVSTPIKVVVVDANAPSVSPLTLSVTQLWPANHQMVDVTVSYTATDDAGAPACSLRVASSEPVNGIGDGDMAPDWQVIDEHHVKLRAERSATGNGRFYTISADCVDQANNMTTRSATVFVPKNQR